MAFRQFNPSHPGELISEDYLTALSLSANAMAEKPHVHPSTLGRVLKGTSDISPEMAVKLEAVLGRSAESWLAMQDNCNLFHARRKIDVSQFTNVSA